jgi:hypothetical protein
MGRDTWRYAQHEREREAKRRTNPIWRGVGCVLLVALAIAGYLVAGWFLRENAAQNWLYLPPELLTIPRLEFLPTGIVLQLFIAFLFMLFGYGVLSIAYAIAFPVKPGETDVPPLKRESRTKGPR